MLIDPSFSRFKNTEVRVSLWRTEHDFDRCFAALESFKPLVLTECDKPHKVLVLNGNSTQIVKALEKIKAGGICKGFTVCERFTGRQQNYSESSSE